MALGTITSILNDPNERYYSSHLDKYKGNEEIAEVLKLFAYRTYSDFKSGAASPKKCDLTKIPGALTKLKVLTLSNMFQDTKVMSFDKIKSELDLDEDDDVVDILIKAQNHNIIYGKIDELRRVYHCHYVTSRHVPVEQVDDVIKRFNVLIDRIDRAIADTK